MTAAHDDPLAAIAGALGLQASPAPTTTAHRRLLATVTVLHEELEMPETLVQFLDGCCRHLARVGMMTALHDGLDPIGPEVIEVLIRYARETYASADAEGPGGALRGRVIG